MLISGTVQSFAGSQGRIRRMCGACQKRRMTRHYTVGAHAFINARFLFCGDYVTIRAGYFCDECAEKIGKEVL
jgi:hypothetical protein